MYKRRAVADALGAVGVPAGPVNSIAEAFENPQVKHRGIAVPVDHPGIGSVPMVHSPFRFSETPVQHRPAPELGAHTVQVLKNECGIDDHEVVVDAKNFGGDDLTSAHLLLGEGLFEELGNTFGLGGGRSVHQEGVEDMKAAGKGGGWQEEENGTRTWKRLRRQD